MENNVDNFAESCLSLIDSYRLPYALSSFVFFSHITGKYVGDFPSDLGINSGSFQSRDNIDFHMVICEKLTYLLFNSGFWFA
ncbi:hypothetical protein D3C80_773920 [compost metagenome]